MGGPAKLFVSLMVTSGPWLAPTSVIYLDARTYLYAWHFPESRSKTIGKRWCDVTFN